MTGGAGADRFVFIVRDFGNGNDRIVLAEIDANTTNGGDQGFAFVGTAAFSGTAGELRFGFAGGNTVIEADVNGDGSADMTIRLIGQIDLTASDFVL